MNKYKQVHQLDINPDRQSKYKYICKQCHQEWVTLPQSTCPRVKTFSSRDPKDCPSQYKTLAELEVRNLRPKDPNQPIAAFRPARQGSWEFLYDETKAISKKRSDTLLTLLKGGFNLLAWFVNVITAGVISILLGLNPAPASLTAIPLMSFVLDHPISSLTALGGTILLTLIGSLIFLRLVSDNTQQVFRMHFHPWSAVTATSTLSFICCFFLLMIVLLQPSWCPSGLCHSPTVLTSSQGVHDVNLDAFFIAFQSTSYVIAGDPQKPSYIPDSKNPHSVSAVLLDQPPSPYPYRIAIGLHSLYQGKYSILINRVTLMIKQVIPVPRPLHVYVNKLLTTYQTNPYLFVYDGQTPGQGIKDTYTTVLYPRVQLLSGESDQLDIEVSSHFDANIYFQLYITYNISNEANFYTLIVPQTFEVVFSKSPNWYEYQFQQGHFTPK